MCKDRGIRYALAHFSGANKVAPFVRIEKTFAFIDEDIETVASRLNLKKVTSGSNVIFLRPFDQGIFYQSREERACRVDADTG